MPADQRQWSIIAAYLNGTLPAAERDSFEQWMATSQENQRLVDEAQKIWKNSGVKLQLLDAESGAMWLAIRSAIQQEQNDVKDIRRMNMLPLIFKIAAGLLILVLCYYAFQWTSQHSTTQTEAHITATEGVQTFYLPDSTCVWLNVGSSLRYDKSFERHQVRLTGEGFFYVKAGQSTPFTVFTTHTQTRVTGTAFNLQENDSVVILSVARGSVFFGSADHQTSSIEVRAGEHAVYHTEKKTVRKKRIETSAYAKWRLKNNARYTEERTSPAKFLINSNAWHKNAINLSVIEGTLKNSATLAAYRNIVLRITYKKPNDKVVTVKARIKGTVRPGEIIPYKKHLFDVFTDTRAVMITVESATVVEATPF